MTALFLIGLTGLLVVNALLHHNRLVARLELRRLADLARGGEPPDLRGVSGHERADIQVELHRLSLRTRRESAVYMAHWLAVPVLTGLAGWALY